VIVFPIVMLLEVLAQIRAAKSPSKEQPSGYVNCPDATGESAVGGDLDAAPSDVALHMTGPW